MVKNGTLHFYLLLKEIVNEMKSLLWSVFFFFNNSLKKQAMKLYFINVKYIVS